MKKIIILFLINHFAVNAYAQDSVINSPEEGRSMEKRREEIGGDWRNRSNNPNNQENRNKEQFKKDWQNKYQNASPEEKQTMERRREEINGANSGSIPNQNPSANPPARPNFMENISPEKKELVKKELERHRQAMKNIAGIDILFADEEKNLSPDVKKQRSEKNRQIMDGLSNEKKLQVKQEFDLHRQTMKNITGIDMPIMGGDKRFDNDAKQNCKMQEVSKEEMEKHRKIMESLSADKKALVKKEMERHRQEMKNITGVELPMPKCQ